MVVMFSQLCFCMSDADGHHWSDAFFGMAFGLYSGVSEFVFWFGDCINCNLDLALFYTTEPIPGRPNRVRYFLMSL